MRNCEFVFTSQVIFGCCIKAHFSKNYYSRTANLQCEKLAKKILLFSATLLLFVVQRKYPFTGEVLRLDGALQSPKPSDWIRYVQVLYIVQYLLRSIQRFDHFIYSFCSIFTNFQYVWRQHDKKLQIYVTDTQLNHIFCSHSQETGIFISFTFACEFRGCESA